MKIQQQFKVHINYKSGIQEEFWVSKFSFNGTGYTWRSVSNRMCPLQMSSGDVIESVYQVCVRKRIVFSGE